MLFKAPFSPGLTTQHTGIFPVPALFQTSVGLLIAFFPTLISFFLYCEIISLIFFLKRTYMCYSIFFSLFLEHLLVW